VAAGIDTHPAVPDAAAVEAAAKTAAAEASATAQAAAAKAAAETAATKAAEETAAAKAAEEAAAAKAAATETAVAKVAAALADAVPKPPAIFGRYNDWYGPGFVPTAIQIKALDTLRSSNVGMNFGGPSDTGAGYSTHHVIDAIIKAIVNKTDTFTDAMQTLVCERIPTPQDIRDMHISQSNIQPGPVLLYAGTFNHDKPLRPQQNRHVPPRLMVEYMMRMAGLASKQAKTIVATSMADPRGARKHPPARAVHTPPDPPGKAR